MSYFSLLRKHGLKIWLSNLLGNLAASMVVAVATFILVFAGMIIVGATAGPLLMGLNENMTEEELLQAMNQLFSSPGVVITLLILFLLFFIFILLPTAFQTAGSIAVATEAAAFNRSDIGTYFSKGFKYTGKMFLFFLLSSLLYSAVFVVGGISLPLFATDSAGGIIIGILLILVSLILAVVLGLALMHAPVILIAENTSVTRAISKSFYLVKRAFGRVFGSAFYSFLIAMGFFVAFFIVMFVLALIMAGFSSASGGEDGVSVILSLVGNLIGMVFSWVAGPVITTLTSLLIIYRYFKYMRHWINPNSPGGESPAAGNNPNANFTPSFSIKTDAGPSSSASNETFHWDSEVPPRNNE